MTDYRKLIAGLLAEGLTYDAQIKDDGTLAVTYNDGHTVSIFGSDCSHIETIEIESEDK